MRKKLLTKHCAMMLLALFAAAWNSNIWACVTINVKASSAPHIYAWDSNQTAITSSFPGDEMTDTKVVNGVTYYTKTFDNYSSINVLFNAGSNEVQTGDFTVSVEEAFFNYDGNTLAYGFLPDDVAYEASGYFAYFVNTKKWTNVHAYVWNGGSDNGWPGAAMTSAGTDGAGQEVLKFGPISLGYEPASIIFNNGNGKETATLTFQNGGYYVYGEYNNGANTRTDLVATIDASRISNSSTYFADEHFREAITRSLGVEEGKSFEPSAITVLDLSYDANAMTGKISNINTPTGRGIAYFTNLEELDISNNNIAYGDITSLTKLKKIVAIGNPQLSGFGVNAAGTDNKILRISSSSVLEYVDVSNTAAYSLTALNNNCASTLKTLIAANNPTFDYGNFSNCSALEHLDFSNCGLISDALNSNHINCPNLEYLDCSGNRNLGSAGVYLTNMTKLKYFDMSGCDATPATTVANLANAKSTLEYLDLSDNNMSANGNDPALDGFTALQTFKFKTQANWTKALTITNCPALTYIDVSGNVKMTGLTINNSGITTLNFPEATTLTSLTALTTLNVSNNPFTVLNIPQTPNSLLTVTASDCNTMTKILAEHNKSKLQYVTAHNCPALTDITINGADIYFNKQLNAFDATNKSTLETLDLSNDAMSTNYALDGFTALQTVDFDNNYMEGNNNTIHEFTATNCPALTSVNLGGITGMKTVDLSGNSFSNNSFATVIIDDNAIDVTLKLNNNNFTSIPSVPNKVAYLYLQDNEFAEDLSLDGDNIQTLKGVALSNKSSVSPIKTFTASVASITPDEWDIDYTVTPPVTILANADENDGSNTTLECINLNGNTALETVTVNGFKGLTKLASDNDMTTDKGKGLYVKGNTSIKNLDISNNRFEILGQDNSLYGLSNLETLNASHNKIMTLTNRSAISGAKNPRAAYGNGTYTSATCPNIEDLTRLKDLNLSYNLLSDSIHLWKNTALERLDVSHNRTINQRNVDEILYYRDTKDGSFKQWKETSWKTVKDMYTNDLNDTIGLRMLDLWHNTNLKYLDISYTNIENTALNWSYVNNRVGPENLQRGATDPTTGVIIGQSGIPRFVLVNHCPELIEFRTNYNAMKSLGVGHAVESGPYPITGCPKLEHLEAIECRGQDPYIMQGEITLSVYNPLLKYYNVSNSNFDKVNPYTKNEHGMSGQNLETLIVDGNYTKDNASHWNLTNAGTLDVSNNPKLVNLQANKCPNLETVKANHLDYLDIISLTQDITVTTINNENVTTKLANLYVDHDAILDEVLGLETLSALSVYHANDSHFTGDFVMPALAKTTLTDLRVGNEALSLASTRNNLTTVNLAGYSAVKHLETQNNPQIESLNISGFTTTLEHINFANNHIDNSGIGITAAGLLPSLPALKYFNCSNDSKWTADAGNRLTDLILTNSTGIKDIYGNNNDLHYITGSFANLTNIEFAHNHINGIDLSAAPNANVNSEDNGRTIVADCSKFTPHGDFGNVVTVYFFQLDDLSNAEVQNGTQLTKKDSEDSNHKIRYLDEDGLDLTKIVNWISDAAVLTNSSNSKNVTLDPSNMSQYLNPKDVPGTIVVLKAANETANGAEGQATYTYSTGNGNGSVFYLNWSSDGTITGVNSVIGDSDFDLAGTYGGIVVAGKDGTVVGVYDLNGRQVASETITDGKAVITGLTPGIYLVNGMKVLVK